MSWISSLIFWAFCYLNILQMRCWKKATTETWGHMEDVKRWFPICSLDPRPYPTPTFSGSRSFSTDWAESLSEDCLCPKELPDPKLQPLLQNSPHPTFLTDNVEGERPCPSCFSSIQPGVAILASELPVESDWGISWNCITAVPLPPLNSPVVLTPKHSPENSGTEISVSECFPDNLSSDNSMSLADSVHL